MRRIKLFSFLFLAFGCAASANWQDTSFRESEISLSTATGELYGTLTLPDRTPAAVALFIAGSGPTDRNGNSMFTQNNATQMLARELANMGIASVRYDKRGIAKSAKSMKREADLRFDDYINDAVAWIELLKKDKRFNSVTVIGHSEGSLIGMVAALRASADRYISMAGTGKPIDEILKEQLKASPELYDLSVPILDSLKRGMEVKKVDLRLFTLFRPSVQPYMISWIKYNPTVEIKKLKIPVMIVQGTNDFQVPTENGKLLSAAAPGSQLLIIQDMNHVLKIYVGEDRKGNEATYHEPLRPLAPGLATAIAGFINKK